MNKETGVQYANNRIQAITEKVPEAFCGKDNEFILVPVSFLRSEIINAHLAGSIDQTENFISKLQSLGKIPNASA